MDGDTFYGNPEELTEIVNRFNKATDDLDSNCDQLASRNNNLRENWTTEGGIAVVEELETFKNTLKNFIVMTLANDSMKLHQCIGLEEDMNRAGTRAS